MTTPSFPGTPSFSNTPSFPDTAAADHWLISLQPVPALACTHLRRTPSPHVAVSLGEEIREGRAVVFPGSRHLLGDLTVGEILDRSAIEQVRVLGGATADRTATVRTNDYVRPQWTDGSLVLTVLPAAGGVLVPFETRDPTPCCADHA
ncbi:hypothetical protein [Actinoplanes sp. NPDC051494]|uniref:hypothetical protein n=1 Tax=Actinoplanes sp. NPDC051494 TaxID=3363907 RepID=UPI00379F29EA